MKNERLTRICVAFAAAASAVTPSASGASVKWHSVVYPNPVTPPLFAIAPAAPTSQDTVNFVARANGQLYANDCYASLVNGDPNIIINPATHAITVWFSTPDTNQVCADYFFPVMGIDGQFGPLAAGTWQFRLDLGIGVGVFPFTVAPGASTPPLSVRVLTPDRFELSWPTNQVTCAVECNTNLSTTGWQTLTNAPVLSGNCNTIEVQAEAGCRFFRLRGLSP